MSWDAARPTDRSLVSEVQQQERSDKSSFDTWAQGWLYWGDSTGSGGLQRGSSILTQSLGRAFVAPRSQASYPGRDGQMQVVSDESRTLLYVSQGSVAMGSAMAWVVNPFTNGIASSAAGSWVQVDSGMAALTYSATDMYKILFTSAFVAEPNVMITVSTNDDLSATSYISAVSQVGTSSFSVCMDYVGPGTDPAVAGTITMRVYWMASGRTAL